MTTPDGLCTQAPKLFDSTHVADHARAARICLACPNAPECLADAMARYRAATEPHDRPVGTFAAVLFTTNHAPAVRP